jgi:hypothetical protein
MSCSVLRCGTFATTNFQNKWLTLYFTDLRCPTMNDGFLKSKSVRLSQEQIEALERRAKEDKRDISQVIRIALDEFFERLKRKTTSR